MVSEYSGSGSCLSPLARSYEDGTPSAVRRCKMMILWLQGNRGQICLTLTHFQLIAFVRNILLNFGKFAIQSFGAENKAL
jgi:hypothetical protein